MPSVHMAYNISSYTAIWRAATAEWMTRYLSVHGPQTSRRMWWMFWQMRAVTVLHRIWSSRWVYVPSVAQWRDLATELGFLRPDGFWALPSDHPWCESNGTDA